MKIRIWDTVKIMSWKRVDKNKEAKVLKVLKEENKIIVEWVNMVTRHVKKMGTTPGQIVKMEKAIDASAVMLVCPITKKPTRVWFVFDKEDKKFRYSKVAAKETGKSKIECIVK